MSHLGSDSGSELRNPLALLGEERQGLDVLAERLVEQERIADGHRGRLYSAEHRVENTQEELATQKLELLEHLKEAQGNGSSADYIAAVLEVMHGTATGEASWLKFKPFADSAEGAPTVMVGPRSIHTQHSYEPLEWGTGVVFGLTGGDLTVEHYSTSSDAEPELEVPLKRVNGFVMGGEENGRRWGHFVGPEAYRPDRAINFPLDKSPSDIRVVIDPDEIIDDDPNIAGVSQEDQSAQSLMGVQTKLIHGADAVKALLVHLHRGINPRDAGKAGEDFPPRQDVIAAALLMGIEPEEIAPDFNADSYRGEVSKLFLRGVAGVIGRVMRAEGEKRGVAFDSQAERVDAVPIHSSPALQVYLGIDEDSMRRATELGLELGSAYIRSDHYDDRASKRGEKREKRLPIADTPQIAVDAIKRIYGVQLSAHAIDTTGLEQQLDRKLREEVVEAAILDRF